MVFLSYQAAVYAQANFKNNEAGFLKKPKLLCLTSVTTYQGLLELKNLAVFQIIKDVNLSQ